MSISREVLAKYIKPGSTFIECGSRWGDTLIRAIECGADRAWGCESDTLYANVALQHVSEACPKGNAVVYNMASVWFLSGSCTSGTVFLDAHTETKCAVMEELSVIDKWTTKPAVILIDDMRCMKDWGVDVEFLNEKLKAMGYTLSRENGVVPEDILVARL